SPSALPSPTPPIPCVVIGFARAASEVPIRPHAPHDRSTARARAGSAAPRGPRAAGAPRAAGGTTERPRTTTGPWVRSAPTACLHPLWAGVEPQNATVISRTRRRSIPPRILSARPRLFEQPRRGDRAPRSPRGAPGPRGQRTAAHERGRRLRGIRRARGVYGSRVRLAREPRQPFVRGRPAR